MEDNNIEVPLAVIQGLEDVRQGGKYNMFESQNVFNELFRLGHYEAVNWLLDENWREGSYKSQVHSKRYTAALQELGQCNSVMSRLVESNK